MLHPIKVKTWFPTAFPWRILAAATALLVAETNWFYQQYFYYIHKRSSSVPDVSKSEMFLYLATVI
jgi:hypothetical protein